MNIEVYSRLRALKLNRVSEGLPLYDMSMVNPDLSPKREIVDRLQEAILQKNVHKYSVARGINKLRQSFSSYYRKNFNVKICADNETCLTLGAKDALNLFLQSFCKDKDTVLVGAPTYPAYISSFNLYNLNHRSFTLSNNIDLMLAEISEKLKSFQPRVLVLNFPNNPLGIDVDNDFYKKLKIILKKHNDSNPQCAVCNDFVYSRLVFDKNSAASLLYEFQGSDVPAIEFYSLSKSYSLPGWRIACALGSESIINQIAKIKSVVDYGIFIPLQIASSFVLNSTDDYISSIKQNYFERAIYLEKILTEHGFETKIPNSACSLWAKVPTSYNTGEEYAYQLLENHGIAVLPGILFGKEYSDFVRFALVLPDSKLYKFNIEFK